MEEKKIDYEAISAGASPERKQRIAKAEMEKAGYVSLSDALVNRSRDSVIVLQVLDAQNNAKRLSPYKIKIVRDQFGDPPVAGDIHEWKWQVRTRDDFGNKIDQSKIHDMVRRGDDTHIEYHSAVIDADGCITIPYEDAVMLLNNHGIHYGSHMPISKMREFSRQPQKVGEGERHMWNWRYMEVPPWIQPADATTETAKKRGRPSKKIGLNPQE